MALTYNDYTGNGIQTTFAIPFDRISNSHVKVFVNSAIVTTGFSIVANNVVFSTAPSNGVSIRIKRQTEANVRLIDYVDGSRLNQDDLDTDSKQAFYLVQESNEQIQLTALEDIPPKSVDPSRLSDGGPTWDTSGNLTATSFVGPLTGNVTGNLTGNVTGSGNSTFAGNVGIGTSSPSQKLGVNGSIDIAANGQGIYFTDASGGKPFLTLQNDNNLILYGTNASGGANTIFYVIQRTNTPQVNLNSNPITNCPTTAKAWGYVTAISNTSGGAQSFTGYNVASIIRSTSAGLYTITLTSGTFSGPLVLQPISGSNNAGARVFSYSGNTCVVQMYVGATATDMSFNFVYFAS
jgi:hypothetical protein